MLSSEQTTDIVKNIISEMMEVILGNVPVREKPFKGYPHEIRLTIPSGNVWGNLAAMAGQIAFDKSLQGYEIHGLIPEERFNSIREVLAKLEHPEKDTKRVKPNWNEELEYVLEGQGQLLPATVVCDLYLEKGDNKYAFELKSPLPNSDITKVSKEKIFKLYSMVEQPVLGAFYVLPYNPYGKREDYSWSFPFRWFDMKNDKVVMIGDEFWNFLGGEGTYTELLDCFEKAGVELRTDIDDYFGRFNRQ